MNKQNIRKGNYVKNIFICMIIGAIAYFTFPAIIIVAGIIAALAMAVFSQHTKAVDESVHCDYLDYP